MLGEKRAAIAGVTGFIGRGLPSLLAQQQIRTTGISRAAKQPSPEIDRWQSYDSLDFAHHFAVINLAGAPVDKRWTRSYRQKIIDSRVGTTRQIVAAIARLPANQRPAVLINGSATGYYGNRADELLSESANCGDDFLANVCSEWEAAALEAESLGVRVVLLRIGVVLGKEGPAFKKLRLALSTGLGGRLGSGQQWVPWIHLDDLRRAIVYTVTEAGITGPVNGTAPHPERNAEMTKKFANALHRPAIFPVPGFALQLALGGFASALLGSQKAVPSALIKAGFEFEFQDLESALSDLIG